MAYCVGRAAAAVAAALFAVVGCSTPEMSAEWAQCRGGPGITADAGVSGCTAIIASGRDTDEKRAEAFYNRCRLYEEKGERDAAIGDCDRAIELAPNFVEAYRTRATVYLNKGDDDHAIADYAQAIKLKPSAGAFTLRGMAYAHKGDYDRAIADYTHALELYPGLGMAESGIAEAKGAKARLAAGQTLGDVRAWCDGKALVQEGRVEELQISGCTKLIESGKEKRGVLARDFYNRARAYDFTGDRGRAVADYGRAIKLDPKNADAYVSRGMIHWLNADHDRAIADLDRAIRLKPDNILALMYRGRARSAKGRFDSAIADFDRAIKLQPENAEAYVERALADNGKGDYRRAIADSDRAIKLSHTSEATEGYNSRGDAHFHLNDWPSAIDDYDHALKLWPEYPLALYGRGAAKTHNGDGPGGRADMEAAAKLKSDVATVEAKLGIRPAT